MLKLNVHSLTQGQAGPFGMWCMGPFRFGQCAVYVLLLKLPHAVDCLLFQPVQCVALEHWALCPLVSGVVHLLVPLPCLPMLTSVQGMHLETTIVQSGLHIRATDYGLNNIWPFIKITLLLFHIFLQCHQQTHWQLLEKKRQQLRKKFCPQCSLNW